MASLKLLYFDLRARAEVDRLMLINADKKFEDEKIPLGDDRWKEIKPTTPWGHMPVLYVDGVQIGQSGAVARYIARETGHYGSSVIESALIDSVNEHLQDLYKAAVDEIIVPEIFQKVKKEEERNKFMNEKVPAIYGKLETFLISNKGGDGYFVGNKVSLADLQFFAFTDIVQEKISPDVLSSFPKLQALYNRVQSLPKVAAYLKTRPQQLF